MKTPALTVVFMIERMFGPADSASGAARSADHAVPYWRLLTAAC